MTIQSALAVMIVKLGKIPTANIHHTGNPMRPTHEEWKLFLIYLKVW